MNISAKVLSKGWENNGLFRNDLAKIIYQGKSIPREDDNIMHVKLKEELEMHGHSINTSDLISDESKIDIEFHFDYNLTKKSNRPSYMILPEVHEIYFDNRYEKLIQDFDKIFTFNDSHVDNKKFIKLVHPILFNNEDPISFHKKKYFSCLIGSNKSLQKKYYNCGYSQRSKLAKWFNNNHPELFNLYGLGWKNFFSKPDATSKIIYGITNKIKVYPNFLKNVYKGPIKSKTEILKKHKFTFCYENALDIPGYFCELIFDAFNGMSVPIYWGCNNVKNYIPENCFIDRRDFKDNKEMLKYLQSIDGKKYDEFQSNIFNFKKSDKARIFSVDNFVNTIVDTLHSDYPNK